MARAISVKVATIKVIKALEASLAKLEKDYTEQEANKAKYEKARKAWAKEVGKLAIAQITKAENLSANKRYNGEINIDFNLPAGSIELPAEPEQDFVTMASWQYESQRGEIENAIRILKMTDEEVVNATTFKSIAQYL